LLCVYVGSGLGLLLSTRFLGLRRYLRQRHQEMPLAMTGRWLGIGWVLIAGVMLAALFLPRPNAEYAISELPFRVGSPDQTVRVVYDPCPPQAAGTGKKWMEKRGRSRFRKPVLEQRRGATRSLLPRSGGGNPHHLEGLSTMALARNNLLLRDTNEA
jgi:hypothetical protein